MHTVYFGVTVKTVVTVRVNSGITPWYMAKRKLTVYKILDFYGSQTFRNQSLLNNM